MPRLNYSFKPLLTGAVHCYSMFTECFELLISIDMRNCLDTICLEILLSVQILIDVKISII